MASLEVEGNVAALRAEYEQQLREHREALDQAIKDKDERTRQEMAEETAKAQAQIDKLKAEQESHAAEYKKLQDQIQAENERQERLRIQREATLGAISLGKFELAVQMAAAAKQRKAKKKLEQLKKDSAAAKVKREREAIKADKRNAEKEWWEAELQGVQKERNERLQRPPPASSVSLLGSELVTEMKRLYVERKLRVIGEESDEAELQRMQEDAKMEERKEEEERWAAELQAVEEERLARQQGAPSIASARVSRLKMSLRMRNKE